jgi:ubiquitin carboxyl-terminal hydrolase 22/27/51
VSLVYLLHSAFLAHALSSSSCYLSVVLQTFFVNPFLRSHYLADRHNRKACSKSRANEPCLSCEIDTLFSEVCSLSSLSFQPMLTASTSCSNTRLKPLLSPLLDCFTHSGKAAQRHLDMLNKTLTNSSSPVRLPPSSSSYSPVTDLSFLAALNLIHSSSPAHTDNPSLPCPCIVHRTFSGQLRSAVKCERCGHQSETLEPFLDLNLDIRNRTDGKLVETVAMCLERYVRFLLTLSLARLRDAGDVVLSVTNSTCPQLASPPPKSSPPSTIARLVDLVFPRRASD